MTKQATAHRTGTPNRPPDPGTPEASTGHPYVYTENAMREQMGWPTRDTYSPGGG